MSIKLYNTLTRQKEIFKPIQEDKIGMYHCGPTVYNDLHIGNFRSYIFADILRRTFEQNGYKTTQVVNVTDVGHLTSDADEGEDKMTKGLIREGLPFSLDAMHTLGTKYFKNFLSGIEKLNIKKPHQFPRASEHIEEQLHLVKVLYEKGYAYSTSDGVYFDTSKRPDYGKLSGADLEKQKEGARVSANLEKRSPADFALWKFNTELGWDSPWGKGFPGWHLECSAMSMKYLGEHFDVHTGGIDHISIHHENEIAQSESATERPFVNYWLHHGHVLIDNAKMAKSEGNVITLDTLEEKGFDLLAYRYWLLTADYRKTINFSWEAMSGAQEALDGLRNHLLSLKQKRSIREKIKTPKPDSEYQAKFEALMNDDLNTPQAIALIWEIVKDSALSSGVRYATLLSFDKTLGLNMKGYNPQKPPKNVKALAQKREQARKNKDWDTADSLRQEIEEKGFSVLDTSTGPHIRKKRS